MSNKVAGALALLVVLAIVGDAMLNGGAGTLFIAQKLADLVAWIAFWR